MQNTIKPNVMRIRISDDFQNGIRDFAEYKGLDVSSFVRMIVLEYMQKNPLPKKEKVKDE